MKKNIFALIIFTFLFIKVQPSQAYQSWIERECPQDSEVELVFTSSYGKLKYIGNKSSKDLQKESKQKRNPKDKLLGLTVPNPTLEVNLETSVIESPMSEDICVIPEKVEVFFGYVNPVIYIASDIKYKDCQRILVTRHEQTHQQINLLALDYFLPQMKRLIRKKTKELKPIITTKLNKKQAVEEMNDLIMERMKDLVDQFNVFLEQEQGKLDNDENYEFESSVCN